ncbi:A disintegrin and metalloproteinase with thrombospondin motifs 6-like [Lineus longissimus]|uniref:A disintegrin and metalloproteinase with thrombospondin motifs 6-like n=1 Tax=Lineus longissimus TaxID=88925 RepID=UPI00315DABBC
MSVNSPSCYWTTVALAVQQAVFLFLLFKSGSCEDSADNQFYSKLSAKEKQHYFGNTETVPSYEIVDVRYGRHKRETGSSQDDNELDYWFKAFNEPFHLRLKRNDHLIAPGCLVHHLSANGTRLVEPCLGNGNTLRHCFYLGESLQNRTVNAALSTCNGLKGVITTDTQMIYIHPLLNKHAGRFKRDARLRAPHIVIKSKQDGGCQVKRDLTRIFRNVHRPFDPKMARYMELMVVADHHMFHTHRSEIQLYVHTVINAVAGTFVDQSFGAKLYLSIVKLVVFEEEVKGLTVVVDATETLRGFCAWQEEIYGAGAKSERLQYDAAILLTRSDLIYDGLKKTSGIAFKSGMCVQYKRCVLARDRGLQVALTVAHELGHTLGMDHDGDGNNCKAETYMMAYNGGIGPSALLWSECSVEAYREFIRATGSNCLADTPHPDAWRPPEDKPGSFYNMNEQCGFYQGPSSKWCNSTEITLGDPCRRLVCYDPGNMAMCIASRSPMLEGTECGTGKWCTGGGCTEYGEDGPSAINGSWSSWSSFWSPCSRTCGGGVKIKQRYCNNPKPLYGGTKCKGVDLMADICNIQPCETSQDEYQEEQCADTNKEPLNGVYYDWIPDKKRDISQQCQMYCKGREQRTVHMRRAKYTDGTSCEGNIVDYLYRCVAGKCEEFGCDGVLNSGKKYDNCGVCQGYDDTCIGVEGAWNAGIPHEYLDFLTIQNGSTGITIKNENMFTHMALKVNGTYLINGKGGKASNGGLYESEGVLASYDAGTPEIIKIARAVPINLEALVWRSYGDEYDGVDPEITYKYHIQDSDVQSSRYVWDLLWSKCSKSCGRGKTVSISICLDITGNQTAMRADDSFCDFTEKPNERSKACNTQPCPPRWESLRQTFCSKTCGGGTRQMLFSCVISTSTSIEILNDTSCSHLVRPPDVVECNTFECPGVWKSGNWSECSKSCGLGNITREVSCLRDEDTAEEVSESECSSWFKPPELAPCFEKPCTVGKCTNRAMGCSKYGWDVCHKYKEWAELYCSLYCGFCDEDEVDEACMDQSPSTCESFDQATCESFPEYSIVYCRHHCNMCNNSVDDFANKTKEDGKDISQVNCKDGGQCGGLDEQTCSANKTWAIKECPLTCDLCWENAVLQIMEAEDCQDEVNCDEYAPGMCIEYETWAKKNCKRHCGFCKNQVIIVTTTTTPCHDNVDCSAYHENVCVEFELWASKNCRMFCGFCEPDVSVTTHAPCTDKVNCSIYEEDVCTEYIDWSKRNCEKYCKMCNKAETNNGVLPTTPTTAKPCSDKVDCTLYETTVCDDYRPWAQDNCGHFCGFCKSVSGCFDTVDCTSYDANVCTDYADWAGVNCRKSCGLCTDVTTPTLQDECKDSLDTCGKYNKRVCKDHPQWAEDKCKRYCGLCGNSTDVAQTSGPCKDVEICDAYKQSDCKDYEEWGQLNCRKFCGFCIEPTRKKEVCEDLLDCPRYNIDICHSETYAIWATHNCKRYCKVCKVDIEQPRCDDIYFESRGNFSIIWGQCTKTISARIGELVVLKLPPVYVDCDAGEFLRLRDTKVIRQFCGNVTDLPIQVQAYEVDIEMLLRRRPEPAVVEWSVTTKGQHEDIGCRSKSMDALQGHVTSPRYPNRYQSNTNCTTFITVHPDKKVSLTFWHFDVELHSRCKCDYLIITDLWSQRTTDKLCGKKEKFTWVSDSSHIHLQFVSDDSDNWLGYSASYAAVD